MDPVVRFLDGFIWLRIDALDNAVLRWRRLGKYRRWWEPRHAPLRLLHAALVYAWMPFYRRAKTDWQTFHESNPSHHDGAAPAPSVDGVVLPPDSENQSERK